MPTNDPICCECGQHKRAQEDLRECMAMIEKLVSLDWKPDDDINGRALLARLSERYPQEKQ